MDIIKKTSPHFNERRAQMIVIHSMTVAEDEAFKTLEGDSEYEVSCHYALDSNAQLYQYVEENFRAWHAGLSYWRGLTDINSVSIGIEVIAPEPNHDFNKAEFTQEQMETVLEWARDVAARHKIKPENIVGHTDISPGRKPDPGKNFNWRYLAENGVGLWHDLSDDDISDTSAVSESEAETCLILLKDYGYDLRDPSDEQVKNVVTAFQTHFLPNQISGKITGGTYKAIQSLIKKMS